MLIITVLSFTIINLWRLLFYAASDGLLWFWLLIFISIKLFTVLSWKDLQLLGLHLSCSGGFTVNAILWVPFIFPLKTHPVHSSYFVESIWNNCSVHTFSFLSFMRPKLSITLTVILKNSPDTCLIAILWWPQECFLQISSYRGLTEGVLAVLPHSPPQICIKATFPSDCSLLKRSILDPVVVLQWFGKIIDINNGIKMCFCFMVSVHSHQVPLLWRLWQGRKEMEERYWPHGS